MIRMFYDNDLQYGDLDRTGGGNFVDDLDLETAVQISLFTERRLETDDEGYQTLGYRGGYWGDIVLDGDRKLGSRLWTLRRGKATQHNILLAKEYATEALQWMIDDGVCTKIVTSASRGAGLIDLRLGVDVYRPDVLGLWSHVWEVQFNAL